MKKTFNYLAIASCFTLGSTLAHANPDSSQGNMHDQMFKDMDADSNKMITREEFNTFGEKKFQKMDANGDGQISSEEMKSAHKKMMGREKMGDSWGKKKDDARNKKAEDEDDTD